MLKLRCIASGKDIVPIAFIRSVELKHRRSTPQISQFSNVITDIEADLDDEMSRLQMAMDCLATEHQKLEVSLNEHRSIVTDTQDSARDAMRNILILSGGQVRLPRRRKSAFSAQLCVQQMETSCYLHSEALVIYFHMQGTYCDGDTADLAVAIGHISVNSHLQSGRL